MSSIEGDGLLRLMQANHTQNQADIVTLKKGQEKTDAKVDLLEQSVTTMAGEIAGGVKVLKVLAWIIGTFLVGMGIWFAHLESSGKIAAKASPAVVSSSQPPQDSSLPAGYVKQ